MTTRDERWEDVYASKVRIPIEPPFSDLIKYRLEVVQAGAIHGFAWWVLVSEIEQSYLNPVEYDKDVWRRMIDEIDKVLA